MYKHIDQPGRGGGGWRRCVVGGAGCFKEIDMNMLITGSYQHNIYEHIDQKGAPTGTDMDMLIKINYQQKQVRAH